MNNINLTKRDQAPPQILSKLKCLLVVFSQMKFQLKSPCFHFSQNTLELYMHSLLLRLQKSSLTNPRVVTGIVCIYINFLFVNCVRLFPQQTV